MFKPLHCFRVSGKMNRKRLSQIQQRVSPGSQRENSNLSATQGPGRHEKEVFPAPEGPMSAIKWSCCNFLITVSTSISRPKKYSASLAVNEDRPG